MPTRQQRLEGLKRAKDRVEQSPDADVEPGVPYIEPGRLWRSTHAEEKEVVDSLADQVLERAAKSPFTLSKALGSYPVAVLRHLCTREHVPVVSLKRPGPLTRAMLVEALVRWLQQRAMTQESGTPVVQRKRGKAVKPAPTVEEPEPVAAAAVPAAAPVSQPASPLAAASAEDFERDVAEILGGNDSAILWQRVQRTFHTLVAEGELSQADADEELATLRAARKG